MKRKGFGERVVERRERISALFDGISIEISEHHREYFMAFTICFKAESVPFSGFWGGQACAVR